MKIKNNRGFTLVEVMVSLVLLVVLVTLVSTIIISGGNIFAQTAVTTAAQSAADDIFSLIGDRISCAQSVKLTSTEQGGDNFTEHLCFAADGSSVDLKRFDTGTEQYFYNSDMLNGLAVEIIADGSMLSDSRKYFELTITMHDGTLDGEAVYSRTQTIPLLNYSSANNGDFSVTGNNSSSAALYITYKYLY